MKLKGIGNLILSALKQQKVKQHNQCFKEEFKELLKQLENVNKSIASNYRFFPQYCKMMKNVTTECILSKKREILMSREEIADLMFYYNFCDILYGVTSPNDKKKRQLGIIKMTLIQEQEMIEYVMANLQPLGISALLEYNFSQTELYSPVFIAFELDGTIYIVIRGTFSVQDIMADMFATTENINGYNLHKGFGKSALFLLERMKHLLVDQNVIIIGHSYGAAIAAIFNLLLQNIVKSVKSIGFGCPPCLPLRLSQTINCTTVLYENDPVPFFSVKCLKGFDRRLSQVAAGDLTILKHNTPEIEEDDMFIPGTIYHAFCVNNTLHWNITQATEYSELLMRGILQSWKNHTDYFHMLRSIVLGDYSELTHVNYDDVSEIEIVESTLAI